MPIQAGNGIFFFWEHVAISFLIITSDSVFFNGYFLVEFELKRSRYRVLFSSPQLTENLTIFSFPPIIWFQGLTLTYWISLLVAAQLSGGRKRGCQGWPQWPEFYPKSTTTTATALAPTPPPRFPKKE